MNCLRWIHRAIAFTVFAFPQLAAADMLDEPACNALKTEQQRMAADGLKTDMLRGPEWAKANLPAARFEQIKHLIDVEEQIAFRCPLPPPPKVQQADPAAATPADGATPVQKKKKAKKKQPAEDANSVLDAILTGEKPKEPLSEKKKAAKKKESANDAYVPPPATGNAFVDGEAEPVPQPPPGGAPSRPLTP